MGHMSRRYWALGSAIRTAEVQDDAARELTEMLDPTGKKIKQAQFINHHMGNDRAPSMDSGLPTARRFCDDQPSHARIGDDGIVIEGSHTNANGDRIIEAYRKNGPLLERVHIREERVGERTRIISEVYGGHN